MNLKIKTHKILIYNVLNYFQLMDPENKINLSWVDTHPFINLQKVKIDE